MCDVAVQRYYAACLSGNFNEPDVWLWDEINCTGNIYPYPNQFTNYDEPLAPHQLGLSRLRSIIVPPHTEVQIQTQNDGMVRLPPGTVIPDTASWLGKITSVNEAEDDLLTELDPSGWRTTDHGQLPSWELQLNTRIRSIRFHRVKRWDEWLYDHVKNTSTFRLYDQNFTLNRNAVLNYVCHPTTGATAAWTASNRFPHCAGTIQYHTMDRPDRDPVNLDHSLGVNPYQHVLPSDANVFHGSAREAYDVIWRQMNDGDFVFANDPGGLPYVRAGHLMIPNVNRPSDLEATKTLDWSKTASTTSYRPSAMILMLTAAFLAWVLLYGLYQSWWLRSHTTSIPSWWSTKAEEDDD